jgi:PAS domain S-box-containing protein
MLNRLRRLFAPPIFVDEEKTRVSQLMVNFSWIAICAVLLLIATRFVFSENISGATTFAYVAVIVVFMIVQYIVRLGYVNSASVFVTLSLWGLTTYLAWHADGLRDLALIAYIIVIIFSSLLLGWRFASFISALSVSAIWYFGFMEKRGLRVLSFGDPINYARDLTIIIFFIGVLVYLLSADWSRTLQSARVELQERLRAEDNLLRQANYLAALNETAFGLLNYSELRPLLESILRRACDLLDTRHGVIEMVLPDNSALRQDVGIGVLAKYNGTLTRKNEGLTGHVWASGETLVVQNYAAWSNSLPDFVDAGFNAALGIPLKTGNTVIGALVISLVEEERTFTQEQINFMERFAALAAIAIDNARLHEQTQKELAERKAAEARMRAILASIPDMIFEISKDGKFLDYMTSEEVMPMLPSSQFIGRNVRELFPQVIADQTFFALGRALETSQLHAFEYEIKLGGEARFFEARISAITSESAIIMVRDITQNKFAQADRENLINDLEGKNSELERFTYTVSHDLKSPLITIKGFLGFLEQSALNGNTVRLKSDIKRIAEATDKMQLLLNDLLELSRVGRLTEPYQNIEFGELAREVVELLYGRLHEKEITLEIKENLPTVHGDRRRLFEALQNLIDNAAKFMGNQPNPRIEIGHAGFENEMSIFYVKDNGIGIELMHQERIFGLFNKLDAQSEGTGIGLALVKRIIEFHKGRIWVESEVGQGTTFFFTLAPAV